MKKPIKVVVAILAAVLLGGIAFVLFFTYQIVGAFGRM